MVEWHCLVGSPAPGWMWLGSGADSRGDHGVSGLPVTCTATFTCGREGPTSFCVLSPVPGDIVSCHTLSLSHGS